MILDIVFFVVIVLLTMLGFTRGLFNTIVSFFGWFVCIFIAYLIAKSVGNALLTSGMAEKIVNGKLFDSVYGLIPDGLKQVSLSEISNMLNKGSSAQEVFQYVRSQAGSLIGIAFTVLQSAITKDIYLNSHIANAAQVLALELTYQIYIVLVGIAIFVVLRVIIMGLTIFFGGKFRNRELKLWERLGGLGVGAVRGIFCACILTMVFGFVAGFSSTLKKQNDASKVAVPATNWINEKMSSALAKGNEGSDRYQNLIEALEKRIENEKNGGQENIETAITF